MKFRIRLQLYLSKNNISPILDKTKLTAYFLLKYYIARHKITIIWKMTLQKSVPNLRHHYANHGNSS